MFKLKKTLCFLILLIGGLFAVLTGCAGNTTAAHNSDRAMLNSGEITDPSTNEPTEGEGQENHLGETPVGSGTELTEDIDMNVVLLVNQGWDDENNAKLPDAEYPLSGEDAEMVFELFYGHEKEALDSPLESIATLQFQIGGDHLSTSMDALNTLSGIIQGELVAIHLSEDECEALRLIISPYAQNIP